MQLKAVRTNCRTGKECNVVVTLVKEYHEALKSWWWRISEGGVTGYESLKVDKVDNKGWYACAGTKGRWDTLFIPAEEMKKLLT